jgi:hypothetical protein
MRKGAVAWISLVVFGLLCASSASARVVTWAHGGWSWFGDPRSVFVQGQTDTTFVGWIDWQGNITVGAYDPRFGLMRTGVVGHLYHDDHSDPSIFAEPDGRLTVFFSGHNGRSMDYRTTLRPEDISDWGPEGHITSPVRGPYGYTYPNPMMLSGEHDRLYLFWRGSNYSQEYATRTLTGKWSSAQELISAPGQRPYVKYDSNGSNAIAIAFTNGHPRERITSVYFAEYRAGWLRGASGRRLAKLGQGAIAPDRGDLIYNGRTDHASSWVWDTAYGNGHPVVVYATFQSLTNHQYWYARWDGHQWISHFLTYAGGSIAPTTIEKQYSGGIALDHSDPSIVYLSRQVGNGAFEIERWTTSDGGYHWSHTTVVPADGVDNVRPVVPRGGGPVKLVWLRGHYGSYTTYRTSIALLL